MIKIQEIKSNGNKKYYKEETVRQVTRDYLEGLVEDGIANDVTEKEWNTIKDLVYNKMYFTTGSNGIDGGAFIDESGIMYVILEPTPALFKIFQTNKNL